VDLGAVGVEFGLGCAAIGQERADENEPSQVEQHVVEAAAEQLGVVEGRCEMLGHSGGLGRDGLPVR
jgi:hypothetical protein